MSKQYEVTLLLTLNDDERAPEYWNWHELLDLGAGDEDVYVLDSKKVEDE